MRIFNKIHYHLPENQTASEYESVWKNDVTDVASLSGAGFW
ncbi:hypothetical protein [Rhodopirellula sallentina]|uniref:Uncharacterized protein n=1 Tax=Rhodopirellula sallentina SM41 TaxID=1263870 RepID=M5TYP1_9BACT|nr:hypothetical protein [Rhodopirellula sallentina]EMI54310.1 hypothetical protein RSSM_04301 [Rhodopirellula sallentina SM41]